VAVLFLTPAVIGFAVFYVWPAVRSVWFSFTDSTLLQSGEFIGLDNYRRLVEDPAFLKSAVVTVVFVLVNVSTQVVVALGLAVALTRLTRSVALRTTILAPWLIPGVTVGLLWLWILDPSIGVLNAILDALGLSTHSFLASPDQALVTIALVSTWRFAGYSTLLLFAGIQVIPTYLYEAAALDGAGEWRVFRSVTLPLLRPVLTMVVIVSLVGSFQVFDLIQVTTKGGPVDATRTAYFFIYQKAFDSLDLGYASAAGTVLMIVLAGLTLVQLRLGRASHSDLD